MSGKMGKRSRSKKSFRGAGCFQVDVEVFGSPKAKKSAKKLHHRALRRDGKTFDEEEALVQEKDPPADD